MRKRKPRMYVFRDWPEAKKVEARAMTARENYVVIMLDPPPKRNRSKPIPTGPGGFPLRVCHGELK